MEQNIFQLILGSASPRRKELLKHSFLDYLVRTSDLEEVSYCSKVEEIVMDLSLQKARHVLSQSIDIPNPFVIGADTIVVVDNQILGKPTNVENAKEMLMRLSGKKHQVLTGVSFCWRDNEFSFYDTTDVSFLNITNDLLESYLKTGESLDKAGAYGIQGAALGFIEKINGSYSNVVGLPIDKVIFNIKRALNYENDKEGKWRECFVKN